MRSFTPFQRIYLFASTTTSIAACFAMLVVLFRQPVAPLAWLLSLVLSCIYGIAWTQNEEFETPTDQSPVLINASDTPLLLALLLTGLPAVPMLLLAGAAARWWQRGRQQPLGYLFNFNQTTRTLLTVLAAFGFLAGGDLRALSTFPAGTIRFLLLLVAFELVTRLDHTLLVAVGSRHPIREIIAGDTRPLSLVTLIPSAMGVLVAVAAVVAPGLVIPMLIPVVLSRYAIRAIARWAKSHILLEQKVAEQTEAIRTQAEQIKAQEQARHQHTVLLVHDLEKEFQLGERLVQTMLSSDGQPARAPALISRLAELGALFERGLAMSADILLGSRLRAGQLVLQPRPTNLTALVAAVTSRFQPVAVAADVQLTLDCDEVPVLAVDEPKLDRAISNILTNAISYTKGCEQRRVTVSVSSAGRAATIAVSDTGIGIEPELLSHIGQRFHRLAGGGESHHGNGLGLFGVAAIASLHGGAIAINSRGQNQGTTVQLSLAIDIASGEAEEITPPNTTDSTNNAQCRVHQL